AMPLQIGARDVAFPFLNSLSFWLFFFGGMLLNVSFLLGGAPDAGWTSYASLALQSPDRGVDFYILGLQIAGAGTLMGGINFLARSEEHTSELQSRFDLVCRLLLE